MSQNIGSTMQNRAVTVLFQADDRNKKRHNFWQLGKFWQLRHEIDSVLQDRLTKQFFDRSISIGARAIRGIR
jgi:hypothetical protein